MTRNFNVFFDLRLNRRLSEQLWGWYFEMPSRHYDVIVMFEKIWPRAISTGAKLVCLSMDSYSLVAVGRTMFIATSATNRGNTLFLTKSFLCAMCFPKIPSLWHIGTSATKNGSLCILWKMGSSSNAMYFTKYGGTRKWYFSLGLVISVIISRYEKFN